MTSRELRHTAAVVIATGLLWALPSHARRQAEFSSIFIGTDLKDWVVERATVNLGTGLMTISQGPGWLRLDKVLSNFELKLDVRLVEKDAKAGIFLRSWPTFHETRLIPTNGYRIVASANSADVEAGGRLIGHGRRALERRFDRSIVAEVMSQPDAWHHYDIECIGDSVKVTLDGRVVSVISGLENPQGFVALRTEAGAVEFRDISIREVERPKPQPVDGVLSLGAYSDREEIMAPRIRHEAKPQYTREALDRQIQGSVLLSVVVQRDGTVGSATVLQSLDPEFGLDNEALKAVRKWRFEPARKDGQPIPVLVTIELTFHLR